MTKDKRLLVLYKLFFGLLGLSAVVTEIVVLMHRGTFAPANFFSFFTVQSNLFASAILVVGVVMLARHKRYGALYDVLRGAAALYMTVTGIIFVFLLSGLDSAVLTAVPWDNMVLHYITPIAVFIDWLLDLPGARVAVRRAFVWLLYPAAYLAYTLTRGYFVDWYPYPFLDAGEKGYAAVVVGSLVIATVVSGLAWLIVKLGSRRNRP